MAADAPEQMKLICTQLKQQFDYVIVDSPNGLDSGFKMAVAPADEALLVATPDVSSVSNVDRVAGLLRQVEVSVLGLVLNRIRHQMVKRGDMLAAEDIIALLNVRLFGLVPEHMDIVTAANRGVPSVCRARSRPGKAFRDVAARLEGEDLLFAKPRTADSLVRFRRNSLSREPAAAVTSPQSALLRERLGRDAWPSS